MAFDLDETDLKILHCLMVQGRITWSELATILNLSSPAAAERVRRLEERGVISGYAAQVNPDAVDCSLLAFVAVTLQHPQYRSGFLQRVQDTVEVVECHHVTGEDDYLLKIRCQNTHHLEQVISEGIKGIDGILKTRTTIALSTAKTTAAIPLPQKD
ncbi:MAG: Lrp/AsnC family transcriptional regulator [Microcoleaceae cyanobacterium]